MLQTLTLTLIEGRYQRYLTTLCQNASKLRLRIKSLSKCLPVSIVIAPPFSTTIQPLALPRAIQKCFRVVQSHFPRLDTLIANSAYTSSLLHVHRHNSVHHYVLMFYCLYFLYLDNTSGIYVVYTTLC